MVPSLGLRMDLFAIARNNGPRLVADLNAATGALSTADRPALERFAKRVEDEGRISINMRQGVLLSFLVSGRHQNIYEWAAARSARSTKAAPDIMREQLGPYYERRTVFDGFFARGDELRYGALNIGGAGATRYGSYCSVVKDATARALEVAYLRADSLRTYMVPGPAVDGAAVEADAASHPARHCLAARKHAGAVVRTADAAWPALLCNDDDYVEAIFHGDLAADAIECVRMTGADHEALYEFAFEEFSIRLSKAERLEIDTFVMIIDALDHRGIRLEVV